MGNYDWIIIGGGVIGLTIARELRLRHPQARLLVIEKEKKLGAHASGRNSGVIHAGLYYPPETLKAKLCVEGAQSLRRYCEDHGLPLLKCGKVILPVRESDGPALELLEERARANGVPIEILDSQNLREAEPRAHSILGRALFSPLTAVIDPKAVLEKLASELQDKKVDLHFGEAYKIGSGLRQQQNVQNRKLTTDQNTYGYGTVVNAAGLHADLVAKDFGIAQHYQMVPFKGLYHELDAPWASEIRSHIYPVPDLGMPFLGVHFTRTISGKVTIGPTAVPALGRENYGWFEKMNPSLAIQNLFYLGDQYIKNKKGFRRYVHEETTRFLKPAFVSAARALVPSLDAKNLRASSKVGLRAQLLDTRSKELVMDFLLEKGPHSIHVLNAVSPGLTSSFSFARYVADQITNEGTMP